MTSTSERVYHRLPRPLQELALSTKSAQGARRRYGGDFREILADYESRSTWGAAEMDAYRLGRLQTMVRHAAGHVPHYSTAAYRGLADIESIDDLASFPILSKPEVRELGDRLHASGDLGPVEIIGTSGTTASPLQVPATLRADREKWAMWWRYRRWHGIDLPEWCGYFGPKPIARSGGQSWRKDRGQHRYIFSSFHTDPAALDEVISVLQERKIRWIHGFPQVISLTAGRIVERGLQGQFDVRWVTFGGDTVLDRYRSVVTEAFGVTPRQHYGQTEMVANLSECPQGSLHVDEDYSILEVLDRQMIGTSTVNPAFPLIRYQTGDTVSVSTEGCDCGRPGRIVSSLDGRTDDYLIQADGSRLGSVGEVIDLNGISGAQFVQRRPGHAEMHLVAGHQMSASELTAAGRHVERNAPGGLELDVRQVSELTRSRAGKMRLVIKDGQPASP